MSSRSAVVCDATKVVVFSSFVGDHDALLPAGAAAVVEKPDFLALEGALSISGLEPWSSFPSAAAELLSGDAVLFDEPTPDDQLRMI